MILKRLMEVESSHKFDRGRAYRPCDWELDRVRFQNRQWAVTDYGIENVRGPYHYYIAKADLKIPMGSPDRTWIDHMASKNWVDVGAFREAFSMALEIHGVAS